MNLFSVLRLSLVRSAVCASPKPRWRSTPALPPHSEHWNHHLPIDGVFKTKAALSAQSILGGLLPSGRISLPVRGRAGRFGQRQWTFQGPLYKTETVDGATKYRPYRILPEQHPRIVFGDRPDWNAC